MDNIEFLLRRRPWIGGDKFIGPSIHDLLLAYYITQGGSTQAEKFVRLHEEELRKLISAA